MAESMLMRVTRIYRDSDGDGLLDGWELIAGDVGEL